MHACAPANCSSLARAATRRRQDVRVDATGDNVYIACSGVRPARCTEPHAAPLLRPHCCLLHLHVSVLFPYFAPGPFALNLSALDPVQMWRFLRINKNRITFMTPTMTSKWFYAGLGPHRYRSAWHGSSGPAPLGPCDWSWLVPCARSSALCTCCRLVARGVVLGRDTKPPVRAHGLCCRLPKRAHVGACEPVAPQLLARPQPCSCGSLHAAPS